MPTLLSRYEALRLANHINMVHPELKAFAGHVGGSVYMVHVECQDGDHISTTLLTPFDYKTKLPETFAIAPVDFN